MTPAACKAKQQQLQLIASVLQPLVIRGLGSFLGCPVRKLLLVDFFTGR